MPPGLDLGTTITSVLRVKSTGCSIRPFANSCAGIVVFADANTSAGAPSVICAASVLDPANEYFGPGSIAGKTCVSDAAAKTLIALVEVAPEADSPRMASNAAASAAATATPRRLRRVVAERIRGVLHIQDRGKGVLE